MVYTVFIEENAGASTTSIKNVQSIMFVDGVET
jgi:hypothetical protein